MKYEIVELNSVAGFLSYWESGKEWKYAAVVGLDLTPFSSRMKDGDFKDCLFLGCEVSPNVLDRIAETGGLFFPDITGLPYVPFRRELYSPEQLFADFDPAVPDSYQHTPDYKIYRHYQDTGKNEPFSIREALARRLHDFSITQGLERCLKVFAEPLKVVAMMGGHRLSRASADYLKVARISRQLAREGYLMVSGGGPGAMEATHLGAWFAGYGVEELETAVTMLAEAPTYKDTYWLSRAFEVKKRFPGEERKLSIGIPTWMYGHEPPNPFPSHIAKYFANSVREEGLLAIARGGVIYAPGSAGTIQEIFQDACQNHYITYGLASPMVFLGENYWKNIKPVYPMLAQLAAGREYAGLLSISDDENQILDALRTFSKNNA